MKPIAATIRTLIENLPEGVILRQAELTIPDGSELAAAKCLSRLVQKGQLQRLEKGLYYKPKKTAFGNIRPTAGEILSKVLAKSNGYITGTAAYNQLGLTTQNPGVIVIATKGYRPTRTIGGISIRCRRSKITPTPDTIGLLEILDALRAIKKIPDATVDDAFRGILQAIDALPLKKKRQLVDCALSYNPSVRALIGAIYSMRYPALSVTALSSSLNPLTTYTIGISAKLLPTMAAWHIK